MPDLLTADAPGLSALFGAPLWGIFGEDGSTILATDSCARMGYARDYQISDYPQEKGAFESYNKVQVPFQAKVGFLIGPSRKDFLNAVEAAVKRLDLVTVVSPDITYPSANLTHYSYERTVQNGVTLILVDVWCEEVRIVGPAQPADTASTSAATATSSGAVQTTPSSGTVAEQQASQADAGVTGGGRVEPALSPPT